MRTPLLASLLILWAPAAGAQAAQPAVAISTELRSMVEADQAARVPANGKPPDMRAAMADDARRLARARELVDAGKLATAADFRNAAMLFQHGRTPQDALMAHDLAVIAVLEGDPAAKWLAAASMDRYLRRIGLPQRFGTQSLSRNGEPAQREPVDPKVPDHLRRALNVPPLAPAASAMPAAGAAETMRRLADEEAADLAALQHPPVDWGALAQRAQARRDRVRTLVAAGPLATAGDNDHAAAILQSADEPDDLLTAHDLAIVAAAGGEPRARRLIAETLDAFLARTDRPQRYATHIEQTNQGAPRLYPVDPTVPDFIRIRYGAPTLAEARARVERLIPAKRRSPASSRPARPAP